MHWIQRQDNHFLEYKNYRQHKSSVFISKLKKLFSIYDRNLLIRSDSDHSDKMFAAIMHCCDFSQRSKQFEMWVVKKDSKGNMVDNHYRYGLRTLPLRSLTLLTPKLLLSVTIFLYDGYYFSSILCHFSLLILHTDTYESCYFPHFSTIKTT